MAPRQARAWAFAAVAVLVAVAAGPLRQQASAELRATPETPLGWRGDGSGRFPDATPVTEWSRTKNVVWRTAMPEPSNSQPVVVGEYVFVTAEPTTLLCLRRADGKVLWQKAHDLEDLLPDDRREQVKKEIVAAERIRKVKVQPLKHKLSEVTRDLQGLPNDPFLTRQKASLKRSIESLEEKLAVLDEYKPPRADPTIGYSNCTPVTDGKGVFVLFGNGVGAVYDLTGHRKWMRVIRRAKMPFGRSMSPVLVGDALVTSIDKEIVAVRATTGKDLWRRPTNGPSGGLAAARVGDVRVVVTAEGTVIRASDGRFLDRVRQPARVAFTAPVIREGVLYILGDRQQFSSQMLIPKGDEAHLKDLTSGHAFQGVYLASPLYHDGCVYLWDRKNILSIVDAATGRQVRSRRIAVSGVAYSSPTLGGKHIFLGTDDGTIAVILPTTSRGEGGALTVDLKEVAQNKLEPTRSSPVFSGGRMYLRTTKSLYCIGEK